MLSFCVVVLADIHAVGIEVLFCTLMLSVNTFSNSLRFVYSVLVSIHLLSAPTLSFLSMKL